MKNYTRSSFFWRTALTAAVMPFIFTIVMLCTILVRADAPESASAMPRALLLVGSVGAFAILAAFFAGVVLAKRLGKKLGGAERGSAFDRDKMKAQNEKRKVVLDALAAELRDPLGRVMRLADGLISGEHGELMKNQAEDVRIIRQASTRLSA